MRHAHVSLRHAPLSRPSQPIHALSHDHQVRPTRRAATLAIAIVFAFSGLLALPAPAQAQADATLSGTISGSEGPALAKALVEARRVVAGDGQLVKETTTAADGTYTISGLAAGTWNVTIRKDGYQTRHEQIDVAAGEAKTLDVVLVELSGTRSDVVRSFIVIDAESGGPLKNVSVVHEGWPDGRRVQETLTTDADGKVAVTLYREMNVLRFERHGYESSWLEMYAEDSGDGSVAEETVKLQPIPAQTVTISGRVIDAQTGAPVQAWIDLSPDYQHYERSGGCADTATTSSDSGGGTSGSSGSADAIEPAYMCDVPSYWHRNHNSTTSEEDGSFSMKAYPGDLRITVNRVDYAINRTTVTVDEGDERTFVFELEPLPAKDVTLKGRVLARDDGSPIAGASVNVQVPKWGDYGWAQTDEDGRFELKMRPGHTLVSVDVHHYGYAFDVAVEMASDDGGNESTVAKSEPAPSPGGSGSGVQYYPRHLTLTTAAGETRDLEVQLTAKPKPTTTIVGYVVDADAQEGIPGVQVSYQNHATGDWANAITDDTGSYRFTVRAGYSSLFVWHEGHQPTHMDLDVPREGSVRQDLVMTAGDSMGQGWWDPDGDHGGCCYAYAADGDMATASRMGGDDAAMESAGGSGADSFRSASSGSRSGEELEGSGGGLPAYDPDRAGETFGEDVEAPAPASLLAVMLLGLVALGIAGRLQRPRRD